MSCNLQVEVNGQETFSISMKLISFFSGKIRRLFDINSTFGDKESFKLILNGFPGGPEGFELITRFCYNRGKIDISPSNVILLHAGAKALEINDNQTAKYLESIHFWTWSELLDCLKHCQKLPSSINSSYIVQKILDALVDKISATNISSPCSENSSVRFSGDESTNYSSSSRLSNYFQAFEWLQDLEFLSIFLFEKMSNTMISKKLDFRMVCSFLVHYQRMKFVGLSPSDYRKSKIVEIVISSLCSLNGGLTNFPFRSLCDLLRVCLSTRMEDIWVTKVEGMIGARLDEAKLDHLLVRCSGKTTCAYDVSLVMRLLKVFLGQREQMFFAQRLKRVGSLMDSYIAEVAPDPDLKASEFVALTLCLPDSARESHDRVFEAIDMYFKVHKLISKEEKMKICSALNYDKLSSESLVNITKSAVFPASTAAAAHFFLKFKRKNRPNDAINVELSRNSSFFGNDDEQILAELRKRKGCRKFQKKIRGCC